MTFKTSFYHIHLNFLHAHTNYLVKKKGFNDLTFKYKSETYLLNAYGKINNPPHPPRECYNSSSISYLRKWCSLFFNLFLRRKMRGKKSLEIKQIEYFLVFFKYPNQWSFESYPKQFYDTIYHIIKEVILFCRWKNLLYKNSTN